MKHSFCYNYFWISGQQWEAAAARPRIIIDVIASTSSQTPSIVQLYSNIMVKIYTAKSLATEKQEYDYGPRHTKHRYLDDTIFVVMQTKYKNICKKTLLSFCQYIFLFILILTVIKYVVHRVI